MVAVKSRRDLAHRLVGLAAALEGLDLDGASLVGEGIAADRDRIAGTIRGYLIPRVEDPGAPLLVVFAGPTGAGKSTLVNSLVGLDLTPAGALRPTTSRPLVLARDEEGDRATAAGVDPEVVIGSAPILGHMTFVDTPDIDSTSTQHRVVAETLIDRADIVVFVTSALRYSDDVPWEVLRRAISRGATVIPVLNRIGPGASGMVTDFASRLRSTGIDLAPVRVPEHHLQAGSQRVPASAVRELKRRLFKVAKARRDHRTEVVNRVLNSTTRQADELARRVAGLREELGRFGDAMEHAMSVAPSIEPDPTRLWAAHDVSSPPSDSRLMRRWARREQRQLDAAWLQRVEQGLAAELETRLRTDLADHGGPVISLGTGLSSLASGASAVLVDVVRSWVALVDRIAEAAGLPGLGTRALVSAVLVGGDLRLLAALFGEEAHERVAQTRRDLDGRLTIVWRHHGARLAEIWSVLAGDPDPGELTDRVASVAAAYQFADA